MMNFVICDLFVTLANKLLKKSLKIKPSFSYSGNTPAYYGTRINIDFPCKCFPFCIFIIVD
jgi:hypothetical protein